jgi:hypothetical protein
MNYRAVAPALGGRDRAAARQRARISRSEYVASLYREHQRALRREAKIARYTPAYREHPATPEEDALTVTSMGLLAAEPS